MRLWFCFGKGPLHFGITRRDPKAKTERHLDKGRAVQVLTHVLVKLFSRKVVCGQYLKVTDCLF